MPPARPDGAGRSGIGLWNVAECICFDAGWGHCSCSRVQFSAEHLTPPSLLTVCTIIGGEWCWLVACPAAMLCPHSAVSVPAILQVFAAFDICIDADFRTS